MNIQEQIEQKLKAAFQPVNLEVENESYRHQVPEGAETHFRAVIVSSKFSGKKRIERHREIYRELSVELEGPVKALSVSAFDPVEWAERNRVSPSSPPCMGGSNHDNARVSTAD